MYATFDTDFGVEYSPSTFRLVVFSLLEHTWTFQSWLESLSLPQRRAKTTALNSPHLVCPQLWHYPWLVQNQPWSGHNIWQIPGTASNVETSRGKHCITNVAVDVSSQETWHCELYIYLFLIARYWVLHRHHGFCPRRHFTREWMACFSGPI